MDSLKSRTAIGAQEPRAILSHQETSTTKLAQKPGLARSKVHTRIAEDMPIRNSRLKPPTSASAIAKASRQTAAHGKPHALASKSVPVKKAITQTHEFHLSTSSRAQSRGHSRAPADENAQNGQVTNGADKDSFSRILAYTKSQGSNPTTPRAAAVDSKGPSLAGVAESQVLNNSIRGQNSEIFKETQLTKQTPKGILKKTVPVMNPHPDTILQDSNTLIQINPNGGAVPHKSEKSELTVETGTNRLKQTPLVEESDIPKDSVNDLASRLPQLELGHQLGEEVVDFAVDPASMDTIFQNRPMSERMLTTQGITASQRMSTISKQCETPSRATWMPTTPRQGCVHDPARRMTSALRVDQPTKRFSFNPGSAARVVTKPGEKKYVETLASRLSQIAPEPTSPRQDAPSCTSAVDAILQGGYAITMPNPNLLTPRHSYAPASSLSIARPPIHVSQTPSARDPIQPKTPSSVYHGHLFSHATPSNRYSIQFGAGTPSVSSTQPPLSATRAALTSGSLQRVEAIYAQTCAPAHELSQPHNPVTPRSALSNRYTLGGPSSGISTGYDDSAERLHFSVFSRPRDGNLLSTPASSSSNVRMQSLLANAAPSPSPSTSLTPAGHTALNLRTPKSATFVRTEQTSAIPFVSTTQAEEQGSLFESRVLSHKSTTPAATHQTQPPRLDVGRVGVTQSVASDEDENADSKSHSVIRKLAWGEAAQDTIITGTAFEAAMSGSALRYAPPMSLAPKSITVTQSGASGSMGLSAFQLARGSKPGIALEAPPIQPRSIQRNPSAGSATLQGHPYDRDEPELVLLDIRNKEYVLRNGREHPSPERWFQEPVAAFLDDRIIRDFGKRPPVIGVANPRPSKFEAA
eukprot:TRINITY_DN8839_c0_g1_i2.p1 TRINITY_DN8839_c0_g1~~TRINITY_DN8839_c0_g1_i2.p1  ORF type:complete len:865 (-),score=137.40 TRINITY_DN8839_c0_g1_i2:168-2762(-)